MLDHSIHRIMKERERSVAIFDREERRRGEGRTVVSLCANVSRR